MSEYIGTRHVRFSEINKEISNKISPREQPLDQDAIKDYGKHLDDKGFPRMVLFEVPGYGYILVAGQHRIESHILTGRFEASFDVYRGTLEEAQIYADEDNLKHGVRLRNADKRRLIVHYLKRHSDRSNVWVAKDCDSTDKTVLSVREELEEASEIPKHEFLVDINGIRRPRSVDRPQSPDAPSQPSTTGTYTTGLPNPVMGNAQESLVVQPFAIEPAESKNTDQPPSNPRLNENPYSPYRRKRTLEERKLPCLICKWPITQQAHLLEAAVWKDNPIKIDLCARCHEAYDIIVKATEGQPGISQELYDHLKVKLGEDNDILRELISRVDETKSVREWFYKMYQGWIEYYDRHANSSV